MVRVILNKTLDSMKISRYELSKRSGIQYQIVDNYYKNKVKRYDSDVLDRMCKALNCDINALIEYSNDDN